MNREITDFCRTIRVFFRPFLHRQDVTQGQFVKQSTAGLNSELIVKLILSYSLFNVRRVHIFNLIYYVGNLEYKFFSASNDIFSKYNHQISVRCTAYS